MLETMGATIYIDSLLLVTIAKQSGEDPTIFFLQLGFQHLIAPGCSSKETKLNFCLSCIPAFETNKHQIQTKISQIKHNILYI